MTEVQERRIKTHLPPRDPQQPLATFLGAFSIGLGLWETFAPESVARATGVRYPALLRAYGLREIAAGLGVLTNRNPEGALWTRVAGDVVDLATLGVAYAEARGVDRQKAVLAATAVLGVTVLDVLAARNHRSED